MANTPYITSTSSSFGVPGPVIIGASATDTVGFFGTTPADQRSSSAQAEITATTGTYGFASYAQVTAMINQVKEIAATLTELGLWKGSA